MLRMLSKGNNKAQALFPMGYRMRRGYGLRRRRYAIRSRRRYH